MCDYKSLQCFDTVGWAAGRASSLWKTEWHQLGHMQVCTWFQTDNHASTHHSVFYRLDALPAAQPTESKHWRQRGKSKEKWRKKDKWASIWYKQANNIYSAEIKNRVKATLSPGARRKHVTLPYNLLVNVILGTNLIHGEKCVISQGMFLKICPISRKIHGKSFQKFTENFTGPTDVISRCNAKAN